MTRIPITPAAGPLFGVLILCLNGCAAESAPQEICTEPRPQICTQQYDPVCGLRDDGTRKTYSNGCTACTDTTVTGWNPGECPDG